MSDFIDDMNKELKGYSPIDKVIFISSTLCMFTATLCFCVSAGLNFKEHINPHVMSQQTIHDTINVLKIDLDTIYINRWKNKTIYETKIERIYMLDSAAVSDEYERTIAELDSLEGAGFFERK